jgi:hypothetical protein
MNLNNFLFIQIYPQVTSLIYFDLRHKGEKSSPTTNR